MKKITVAFFGSSTNSQLVLENLHKSGVQIQLVISAPPRPSGRKQILTKTPVHQYAETNNLPVQTPESLITLKVEPLKVDVAIVADYAKLIPNALLNLPKHGFLNLHPSLLPEYRGSTPAQAAIIKGDKQTGISLIKMTKKFDEGPILSWTEEPIYNQDTQEALYQRLFEIGSAMLTTILPAWIKGQIVPHEQENAGASYAYRLTRNHGYIPWKTVQKAMSGEKVSPTDIPDKLRKYLFGIGFNGNTNHQLLERATRAFYPWPGIWTTVSTKKGNKRLKIHSAILSGSKLLLQEVQLEGQKPADFNQLKISLIL